ncbi:TPT-domain-containing protein [Aureobasidium pullulans]|uniref:TPT-domain-containing protein n=1 Tax=Aureobasidium pullulans TaxID=5580 RepID=A0A4T0C557_AURPU|nr:TPT-domain-containing protein [Aureobasidium pullulans]
MKLPRKPATSHSDHSHVNIAIRPAVVDIAVAGNLQVSGIVRGDAADDTGASPMPQPLGLPNHLHSHERWQARRDSRSTNGWTPNGGGTVGRHGRQKSLSEAIRTVRGRKGSVSQNAHEIADALKAPVSGRLIPDSEYSCISMLTLWLKFLCAIWYTTSIMSNTSSKAILTALPKPVTLTLIQFMFVCSWCLLLSWAARIHPPLRNSMPVLRHGIRKPSRELIMTTLPLTAFQIGGHILSSDAMSRIPVSLVHTIKGLSPLLTVLAYRFVFNVKYSYATYMSLVPLTLGVVMACSASFKANLLGLVYAFGSALLFVTQNIVSKKLFNEAAKAEADGISTRNKKPDKLNLLCYSSGLAFILTLPIWLWSEGFSMIGDFLADASIELSERPGSLDHARLGLEFIFNGSFHFGQNLVAFVLLGLVSPVTYSVASLFKRVFVIVFAIIWFGNPMTGIQGFGIGLTILGLYLYDRTSDAAKADKRARAMQESKDTLLPMVSGDHKKSDANSYSQFPNNYAPSNGGYGLPNGAEHSMRARASSNASPGSWLPPGTKAEETWNSEDRFGPKQSIGVR